MKLFAALTCLLICGFTCNKENGKGTRSFIFGKAYGMCQSNCATFFKIEDGQLFRDNINYYKGPHTISFYSEALPNDRFLLAQTLLDSFPILLLQQANQTIGCPDCADQGGYHIEFEEEGLIRFWHIDTNIDQQPENIRQYLAKLEAILKQL